jgi:hypothetical protein
MKKLILVTLGLSALLIFSMSCLAQGASTTAQIEKDLDLMRRDLRSEKKQILAMNVSFTADEATKFWPVYDAYAMEMTGNYDKFYTLIKDYAAHQTTLTDPQAIALIKRWNDIQIDLAKTREKYIPLVEKVIPGRKAALFFQIDRRLYALMDLQIASEIPLVTH